MLEKARFLVQSGKTRHLRQRFNKNLSAIWHQQGRKPKLGLAVSGGVDSMALAHLCSIYKLTQEKFPEFLAFIVDHGLRVGSHDEAQKVSVSLRNLGIESHILQLVWHGHVHPSRLDNLEIQARRLRFQALGKACRDHDIDTLMLAHHADDQAETALFRLTQGYHGIGLKAVNARVSIPECDGLYGVSQSGQPRTVALSKTKPGSVSVQSQEIATALLEDGGVEVHRPLLGCSKAELVAVCLESDIPWVEDETNQDKTLTPRNAIRSLLQNERMPRALSTAALQELTRIVSRSVEHHDDIARAVFEACPIRFNVRSGMLNVVYPANVENMLLAGSGTGEASIGARLRVGMLIRRLVSSASPRVNLTLHQMEQAARLSFSTSSGLGHVGSAINDQSCHMCDVSYEIVQPAVDDVSSSSPHSLVDSALSCQISRRPPTRKQQMDARMTLLTFREEVDTLLEWSATQWQLFDGRFWIRIHYQPHGGAKDTEIHVRFLTEDDLGALRKGNSRSTLQPLHDMLRSHAPGSIRFTLPAIVVSGTVKNQTGNRICDDRVVAVPSMSWGCDGWNEVGPAGLEQGFYWEIRYKKVEMGKGKLHEFVA